jgi:hypothetical protein
MPRKTFTAGDVLTASDMNTFLMDQSVQTYADSTARDSAVSTATAPAGLVTYLEDTDSFEYWNGTAYEPFGAGETALTLEYLVIAGGGGGGGNRAGGGGAGGYRSSVVGELSGAGGPAEPVLTFGTAVGQINYSTNYTVTVGGGGAGGANEVKGTSGSTSTFILTSAGGGGGGAYDGTTAKATGVDGGCGGGAARSDSYGATPGFGAFEGFSGGGGGVNSGGGGGGAGALGVKAPSTDVAGAGGAGRSSSITGSAVTRAGGGGGGSATLGSGGTGGGGNGGSSSVAATAATANTGGGGGGGGTGTLAGNNGGSGVVILKYPDSLTITIGAGLTGSTSTAGGFSVTTITVGTGNVSWAA